MASPRVFISSTCYDLASERDSLVDFCGSFGFDIVLSERGDVFFHPDLHTHESCVYEVGSCHILVLIIGGRFGGRYTIDAKKSITNAEYSAAREAGIPIFTFIKQDVLQDHNIWQSNKNKQFAAQIHYPSIDKQDHAIDIFKFIDEVRLSKNNNSYFSFNLPREIHAMLRKQWAALFLEGLKHRNLERQFLITNETLAKLTSASERLEEFTKSIYKNVDRTNAQETIDVIDSLSAAKSMLHLLGSRLSDLEFISARGIVEACADPMPEKWWEFLIRFSYFDEGFVEGEDGKVKHHISFLNMVTLPIEKGRSKKVNSDLDSLETSYQMFKSLPALVREKMCAEFAFVSEKDGEIELAEY